MKRWFLAAILLVVMCLGLAGTAMAVEKGQTVVYVGTAEELEEALKSNVKIVLEGKDYTYSDCLYLVDLENVTIQGVEGTRITSTSSWADVIMVSNCQNITLENIVFGHDLPTYSGCDDPGVVYGYNSDITVKGCDIFGCGTKGFNISDCKITVEDSVIHDCTESIMLIVDSDAVFENCIFSGNGYGSPDAYGVRVGWDSSDCSCTFLRCEFNDNENPHFVRTGASIPAIFKSEDVQEEYEATYICKDCSFSGNVWDDNEEKLIESITIVPDNLTLEVGESYELSINIFPEDATNKSVEWPKWVYNDYITIDNQGVVTAVREGTVQIYCVAEDIGFEYSNACTVTIVEAGTSVPEKPDTSQDTEDPDDQTYAITITPSELSMEIGEKKTLSYTSIYTGTSSNAERESVIWHSTNSEVASVDQEGTVTAIKQGTAEIYCVSQDRENAESNRCTVKVMAHSSGILSGGGLSGGGSGSSGSSSSGSGSKGSTSSGTVKSSSTLPNYVMKGTWTQAEDGSWKFTDSAGNQCANAWAAVENPYANQTAGQQAFDWFRFDESGNMVIGWYYDAADGYWYYLNPVSDGTLGKMMTGWVTIDGYYYYFNTVSDGSRGRMYINETTPDGYRVDETGRWVQ